MIVDYTKTNPEEEQSCKKELAYLAARLNGIIQKYCNYLDEETHTNAYIELRAKLEAYSDVKILVEQIMKCPEMIDNDKRTNDKKEDS